MRPPWKMPPLQMQQHQQLRAPLLLQQQQQHVPQAQRGSQAPQPQLHPLAMQSTATCPPIQPGLTAVGGAGGILPFFGFNTATSLPMIPGPTVPATAVPPNSVATAAAAAQNINRILAMYQHQQQQALAGAFAQQQQQQSSVGGKVGASVAFTEDSKPPAAAVAGKKGGRRPKAAKKAPPKKRGQKSAPSCSGTTSSSISSSSTASAGDGSCNNGVADPPPFYLFEAPYELRMNYLQSQRLNDATTTTVAAAAAPASSAVATPALTAGDPNSYHYGMAVAGVSVNGFHPQLNALSNPIVPIAGTGKRGMESSAPDKGTASATLHHHTGVGQQSESTRNSTAASSSVGATTTSQPVRLIDGRSGKPKTAQRPGVKERNEREQRRAQKIAELIENLKDSMIQGGWKVEMKSKYHTLST
mmetsp:Transcript_31351/g.63728  ORF Transcript_31351/g.63728 Transcript_31351/m.63728 type:complete len:416 (-) Transcript_31351:4913-6160(-)